MTTEALVPAAAEPAVVTGGRGKIVLYRLAGRSRPAMTGTVPARATSHPKDRSGAKEVRSTLTRREQRLPLRSTYPPDSPKTRQE